MKTNRPHHVRVTTHQGGRADAHLTPKQILQRTISACLLWENTFYEDGEPTALRIQRTAHDPSISFQDLHDIAVHARHTLKLRHAPLWLIVAMLSKPNPRGEPKPTAATIEEVVSRADELAELLSLYWSAGRKPLPRQLKNGLARAFHKFNEYQFAKYNRDGAIKLRDVMFLVHPKPTSEEQAALFARIASNSLVTPDTWEVALSTGADKKETFTRLASENKLGALALLRNLRNMEQSGVDPAIIRSALRTLNGARVLPFRFIAAARACPMYEPELDLKLHESVEALPVLPGKTIVLVDVSGSMDDTLSAKSDLTRMDAAAALASVVNAESLRVFTFSDKVVEVPPRRGMAGVDAVIKSQPHYCTNLVAALKEINAIEHDRIIVITDEQHNGASLPAPIAKEAYMINVGTYEHGVGYRNGWSHIDGFSENVLRYTYAMRR